MQSRPLGYYSVLSHVLSQMGQAESIQVLGNKLRAVEEALVVVFLVMIGKHETLM